MINKTPYSVWHGCFHSLMLTHKLLTYLYLNIKNRVARIKRMKGKTFSTISYCFCWTINIWIFSIGRTMDWTFKNFDVWRSKMKSIAHLTIFLRTRSLWRTLHDEWIVPVFVRMRSSYTTNCLMQSNHFLHSSRLTFAMCGILHGILLAVSSVIVGSVSLFADCVHSTCIYIISSIFFLIVLL